VKSIVLDNFMYSSQDVLSQLHSVAFDNNRKRRPTSPFTINQATMKNGSREESPDGGTPSSCLAEMQQTKVASHHGSEKTLKSSIDWSRSTLILFFAMLMMLPTDTTAQVIGVDICACQPSVYEFTFDFLLTCADFNLTGPGISDSACDVTTEDASVTDEEPVVVFQIEVLELDQRAIVVAQTQIAGDFRSGDAL
jgi:hypothetical protein